MDVRSFSKILDRLSFNDSEQKKLVSGAQTSSEAANCIQDAKNDDADFFFKCRK